MEENNNRTMDYALKASKASEYTRDKTDRNSILEQYTMIPVEKK